jgi:molybdopterin synthase catalytic subunit
LKLSVRLFASLRERAGSAEVVLDGLPERLDLRGVKRALEQRHPELGPLDAVRCAIGTRYARDDEPVAEGDAVSLIPPVSGGGPGDDEALAVGVFELLAAALDPAACQARVAHPTCGAVALFSGVVRETNLGEPVEHIDYEAFDAMTHAEMERIFARCRAALAPAGSAGLRLLVQHRVGRVVVGEPSVVVAVAAPHRAEAFEACRFLIDALKASVPIWKREQRPDGTHWIGERS